MLQMNTFVLVEEKDFLKAFYLCFRMMEMLMYYNEKLFSFFGKIIKEKIYI